MSWRRLLRINRRLLLSSPIPVEMRPPRLICALTAAWLSGTGITHAAVRVGQGGACSQNNNRLDGNTGNFISDCDARTFCNDEGICEARGCRNDEVSHRSCVRGD